MILWLFHSSCFREDCVCAAGDRTFASLQVGWVCTKSCFTGLCCCYLPVYLREAEPEKWSLHYLEGQKVLILPRSVVGVLAALAQSTWGILYNVPIASASSWLLQYSLFSNFLKLALLLVIAMLLLALEIYIIINLCSTVKCLDASQALRLSAAIDTVLLRAVGLKLWATSTINWEVYFSVSRPSNTIG